MSGETPFHKRANEVAAQVLRHNIRRDFNTLETRLDVRAQIREALAVAFPSFPPSGVIELSCERYADGTRKGFTIKIMASTALKFERTFSLAFLFRGSQ